MGISYLFTVQRLSMQSSFGTVWKRTQQVVLSKGTRYILPGFTDILDKLPESDSVKSLLGVGDRLAQELAATLGTSSKDGHHRFQAAEEIAKLFGCVPVVRKSGKWRKVSLRYACVKSLRRTFHDWAFTRTAATKSSSKVI
ncbi:MAG: transposase ISEch11 [Candidatus Brocadiaceae bacterium]|nr:transposase ISEch11 [Candidatus Brocadiaceae bacterium]